MKYEMKFRMVFYSLENTRKHISVHLEPINIYMASYINSSMINDIFHTYVQLKMLSQGGHLKNFSACSESFCSCMPLNFLSQSCLNNKTIDRFYFLYSNILTSHKQPNNAPFYFLL